MTSKVYRSAQGKMVDLGTIMLQNEHVRAVGNMKVNARGDKIDSLNHVIETRTERIQRQNDRTSNNVSTAAPQTSGKKRQASPSGIQPDAQIQSQVHMAEALPDPVVEIAPPPPPVKQRQAPAPQATPKSQPVPTQSRAPEVDLKNPAKPAKNPAASSAAPNTSGGGLAGAIARSREIKQELDRTRRQKAQDSGLRKI
jgi:outer membrane biosynthesis protein TonB